MSSFHDEAVVLGRLDYSETSQVLVLFTRGHGKVRAIAKGVKRGTKTRFAVGIDLLEIGQVVFTSRTERGEALATLTEWKQSRSLSGLREKLFRIDAAQYVGEITAQFTADWDPHAGLFDVLIDTLTTLSEAPEALIPIVRYQLMLLDATGAIPRFDACVLCGRESDLTHFSSFEGGLVCRHCEPVQVEKREVSAETIATLRAFRHADAPPPGREPASAASFTLLNYHLCHLMGKELKLADRLVPRAVQRRSS